MTSFWEADLDGASDVFITGFNPERTLNWLPSNGLLQSAANVGIPGLVGFERRESKRHAAFSPGAVNCVTLS